MGKSKHIGVYEFVNKSYKLLTVFGVFVALTYYLAATSHISVGISFIISILIGFSILGKIWEFKNARTSLTFFGIFLLLLIFSIAGFVITTFSNLVGIIELFGSLGVGIYILAKFFKWLESLKWSSQKEKQIALIVISVLILIVSFNIYDVHKNLLSIPLNEIEPSIDLIIFPFIMGALIPSSYILLENLFRLFKTKKIEKFIKHIASQILE